MQVNKTISKEQEKFILDNYKTMSWGEMAKATGLLRSKLIRNARMLGINRGELSDVRFDYNLADKNGNFDVNSLGKLYRV